MVKIDMRIPKSCDVCDFNEEGIRYDWCNFPRCGFDVSGYIATRHPNCPLIECEENE